MRKWRKENPIKAAYANLKANAKRRGKEFTITIEQFRQFCQQTDYIKRKGRRATCYHVDRIDETKGYTIDNIQALSNRDNVRKYVRFNSHYDHQSRQMLFFTDVVREEDDGDEVPF